MKRPQAKSRNAAFNLIELLAVLAIVGLLVATFLQPKKTIPRDPDPRSRGGGFPNQCAYNQKQIAEAFSNMARDRDDLFLWVPTGGEKEPVAHAQLALQYRSLSNYLQNIAVLICPSDRTRQMAFGFDAITDTNVSYFMNVDAGKGPNAADTIFLGDRHLEVGTNAVPPGLFIYTNGMEMGWTTELHMRGRMNGMPPGTTNQYYGRWRGTNTPPGMDPNSPRWRGGYGPVMGPVGTLAFVDGHAERFPMNATNLSGIFNRQGAGGLRLLVP